MVFSGWIQREEIDIGVNHRVYSQAQLNIGDALCLCFNKWTFCPPIRSSSPLLGKPGARTFLKRTQSEKVAKRRRSRIKMLHKNVPFVAHPSIADSLNAYSSIFTADMRNLMHGDQRDEDLNTHVPGFTWKLGLCALAGCLGALQVVTCFNLLQSACFTRGNVHMYTFISIYDMIRPQLQHVMWSGWLPYRSTQLPWVYYSPRVVHLQVSVGPGQMMAFSYQYTTILRIHAMYVYFLNFAGSELVVLKFLYLWCKW